MITTNDINNIFGITENFQLHGAIMEMIFDAEKRNNIFEKFLNIESDLSYDWFTNYFQEEQANRKTLMQDYTPNCVCEVIKGLSKNTGTIFDECAGIGSLMISMWNTNRDRVFYLEELSDNAVALLLFNLSIRGVTGYVRHGNVLTNSFKKCYKLTKNGMFSDITECETESFAVNTVISNPPYSLKFEDSEKFENDPRFINFGMPPKSKSDYAFVMHGLSKLSDNGEMLCILPHGVLFRGQAEAKIRKKLIEENYIDAVIGLPEKLFLNTDIPVCILVLRKNRSEKDILFIDASKDFDKDGKQNSLNPAQIKKITDIYHARIAVEKFSHLATAEEIAKNDYNLNIPRYVDTSEPPEAIDIEKAVNELYEIENEIAETEKQLSKMFSELTGSQEYEIKKNKIRKLIDEKDKHGYSNMCFDIDNFIKIMHAELMDQTQVHLYDVADFERSKKNIIYPAGSTLIQVSATKGQMLYMHKAGTVDSKYGVIQPKDINPRYLYHMLLMVMPHFLRRYQTGLNINPEIFKHLQFAVHKNKETQNIIVKILDSLQSGVDVADQEIQTWQHIKKYHLDEMFAQ